MEGHQLDVSLLPAGDRHVAPPLESEEAEDDEVDHDDDDLGVLYFIGDVELVVLRGSVEADSGEGLREGVSTKKMMA